MSKTMDSNDNFVKVTIYGQEYTIADNTRQEIHEKMREVQEELSTPQVPAKVAILAAMNISDDLFAAKRDREKSTNEVERKVSSLIEIVEEAIQL